MAIIGARVVDLVFYAPQRERRDHAPEKSGVKILDHLGELVRRRPGAPRWPYIVPALVALLFVGHALEDAGWTGAAPYIAILALSAVGIIWPTILGWALLVLPFLVYGVVVAMHPQNGPPGEWVLFMGMGFAPVLLLWLGRPWGRKVTDGAAPQHP